MAKKKTTRAKAKKTLPSKAAREAAEAMLAVPTALGLMAAQIQQMTAQLDQMDNALRALIREIQVVPPPNYLTEPAPRQAADSTLLQEEFKHEPKGNIP